MHTVTLQADCHKIVIILLQNYLSVSGLKVYGDLSIRRVFQLDISEFSTDFHLNQLFAYFTVGYG